MPDTLFASLLSMLDKRSLGGVAGALGQSEQSVSRGMESSIAALLGGLTSKSEDPSAVSKILDLAPNSLGDVSWSRVAGAVSDPNSPLISVGKRVLSGLFGTSEGAVTSALSADSGLRPGSTSTLMAMAAPMVMSFLGRRMQEGGMSISGLCGLLQRESGTIRNALPASLSDMFWPRASAVGSTSPVVAQAVEKEKSSSRWLVPLALAAMVLGLFWLFTHARRPSVTPIPPMTSGSANRVATDLGNFVRLTLPNNVELSIPERGVEGRLLAFIQNPGAAPDKTTWFNFDRLVFETASATLRPESQEQLNNIAAILVAYPNVHLKVGGYTDNVGGPQQNLQLSQERAKNVVAELVRKGISPERLTAEGYGEQYPVADNSTEEGRAQNRRVSMRVTQK